MALNKAVREGILRAAAAEEDLAAAALALARLEYPDLSPEEVLATLDGWAARLQPHPGPEGLNDLLFQQERFRGAQADYYSPENSFLNRVLERRRGIPISLCVIYISVGRRAGMALAPIGYPGHFLVQYEAGQDAVYIDVFGGGNVLDRQAREAHLERIFGMAVGEREEFLQEYSTADVLRRMLNNLKAIYTSNGDYQRAADVIGLLRDLAGDPAGEVRDLATVLLTAGRLEEAAREYTRYLEMAPDGPEAPGVRSTLMLVRERLARRN